MHYPQTHPKSTPSSLPTHESPTTSLESKIPPQALITHPQALVAESPLGAISDLSLTTVAPPSEDVHNSNLKHLDHLNDDVVRRVAVQGIICSICGDSVSDGPIYSCSSSSSSSSTECDFFIHKSCAKFPEAIRSVFHPEHLLFFSDTVAYWYICVICNKLEKLGFAYECFRCKFRLHIKCALQYNMQDPQGHEHSLILLKPTLFTCDACGIEEETKRVSFVCTTCQLQVHNNKNCCSSYYPPTVKQIRHPHELSLTFWSQLYNCLLDDDDNTCMICGYKMNGVLCFYYCADCRFMAHVMCAISENLRDEYENENQDRNPTTTLAPGPIETTKEITHVGQTATEIRHFSHPQHCLILSNDPKLNEFCDGCSMPISVPYYTCAADQCNFLLHKQCFELPNKIKHPCHNHQLTLQAKAMRTRYENTFGIFQCDCCAVLCNGFTYTCGKCDFFIDVGCGLFTNPLLHGGHECALSVVEWSEAKCSACGLDCFSNFVCKRCDFNLDYRCASLPNTISHDCPKPEWGTRPYNLTTYSVDDGSGEYYCDICEEPRIHNHWFYYCKNCDYSAHPQCLLVKDRIKLGRTYLSKCHLHSLTLVKEAKDKGMGHPPCATCGDPCKGVAILFCTECDIYIHHRRKCCGFGWVEL